MTLHKMAPAHPEAGPAICHVVHTLDVGGAELLACAFAQQNANRHRVVFACLDGWGSLGRQLRSEGYAVEMVGRRPGFDPGCARRLRTFFRRENVALVHAHQYAPFFYSTLGRIGRHKTPVLFMEHGRDYPDYPRPKRKLANRFLLRQRDRVVAVGDCVRRALIENEGMPANRVEVIYNGISLARYDSARPMRNTVRQAIGLADDDIVIMKVARLNRLKDHSTVVRALAHLVQHVPRVKLVLVGDGSERTAIEQLVEDLSLQQNVVILGTRHDVPQLLQAADVFVMSSITEGISLTLLEAMATGLPCVATRVGGNPEVILPGETGFLAEAGDPIGFAGPVKRLCRDSELRSRFGHAGLQRATELFDDRRMHREFDRIYQDMLAERRHRDSRVINTQESLTRV